MLEPSDLPFAEANRAEGIGCRGELLFREFTWGRWFEAPYRRLRANLQQDDRCTLVRKTSGRRTLVAVDLLLPFRPRTEESVQRVWDFLLHADRHLAERATIVVRRKGGTPELYELRSEPTQADTRPHAPFQHRRMAVVSTNAQGRPSVLWVAVPVLPGDTPETDHYARAVSSAREQGVTGKLLVYSDTDQALLRYMVDKIEVAHDRRRTGADLSQASGNSLLFLQARRLK